MADAMLVGLSQIVDADPTLYALFDLPPGWTAWRRSRNGPWIRQKAE